MSEGFWPNFDQINISHRRPCSLWIVNLLTWQKAPERGYDEKSWEMACNWLMMTSSGDDNRPSGSLGLLTDKTKKNKTAVRFKPRCKAQGYSHWPTALLLLFSSFCERSARETWHSYRRHLLLHNNRLPLRETWLSPFSIWRCYVTKGRYWEKRQ